MVEEVHQHLLADAREELHAHAGAGAGLQHADPGRAFILALELVADADATEPVGVDLGRAGGRRVAVRPHHGGQQRAADDGLGVQALAGVVAQRGAPGHAGADRLEGVGVAGGHRLGAHVGVDPLGEQARPAVLETTAQHPLGHLRADVFGQVVDAGVHGAGGQEAGVGVVLVAQVVQGVCAICLQWQA